MKLGTLMLIITNECNLDCVYCYENNRQNSLISLETAKSNITNVMEDEKFTHINISLFGGEPFIYFERIKEICEWTWSKKWTKSYKFTFSTNGTVLTDEIKTWIRENKEKLMITLSLDGMKKSHDLNRNNSFDLIDLNFFKNTWDTPAVKMTISELSLPYLADDVIFIHNNGFTFAECNLAFGIDWSNEINKEKLKLGLSKLLDFYINNPDVKPAQIIGLEVGGCENNKVQQKWCGVGRELMTIDVDGKAYPCNFITPMSFNEKELKLLLETDFTDIREILDKDCFEKCYLYSLCPTCYGADYLLTKSINKRDRTICDLLTIRAYFSGALQAEKILSTDIDNLDADESGKIYKTIKAILKVSELYEKM